MLKVEALGHTIGNRTLFSGITFSISAGQACQIRGANGAGKSTFLKILASLIAPTEGCFFWQQQLVVPLDPSFLKTLLYIGHEPGLVSTLTPMQNLQWLLKTRQSRESTQEALQGVLEILGLAGLENKPCERLSKGQRQRISLARLWVQKASCWILDEPFSSLDEAGIALVSDKMALHLKEGGILVFANHSPFEISGPKLEIAL